MTKRKNSKRWFQTLDHARGFAEGLEYVNDSQIHDITIEAKANEKHVAGWLVRFQDDDGDGH